MNEMRKLTPLSIFPGRVGGQIVPGSAPGIERRQELFPHGGNSGNNGRHELVIDAMRYWTPLYQ